MNALMTLDNPCSHIVAADYHRLVLFNCVARMAQPKTLGKLFGVYCCGQCVYFEEDLLNKHVLQLF